MPDPTPLTEERENAQAAIRALLKAGDRVRKGYGPDGWLRGAPTHVLAELLGELDKDGWHLRPDAFYSERERVHEESQVRGYRDRQALRTTLAAALEREGALREALTNAQGESYLALQGELDRTHALQSINELARASLEPTDPAPSTTEGGPRDDPRLPAVAPPLRDISRRPYKISRPVVEDESGAQVRHERVDIVPPTTEGVEGEGEEERPSHGTRALAALLDALKRRRMLFWTGNVLVECEGAIDVSRHKDNPSGAVTMVLDDEDFAVLCTLAEQPTHAARAPEQLLDEAREPQYVDDLIDELVKRGNEVLARLGFTGTVSVNAAWTPNPDEGWLCAGSRIPDDVPEFLAESLRRSAQEVSDAAASPNPMDGRDG